MFGRFLNGECSLSEAFWKFSVLGIIVLGFVTRVFSIFLLQASNYEMHFIKVVLRNISLLSMQPTTFVWLCCYIAAFLVLVLYAFICVVGMWKTYKYDEKSKTLAFVCMAIVWGLAYIVIRQGIYG